MKTRDPYTAIADPTRREILNLLRDEKVAPAGAIAAHFSDVSRPGISRHLRVLKECGLVDVFRSGKTQNYMLNPEPINEMREGWLASFADMHVESLARLRKIVESD